MSKNFRLSLNNGQSSVSVSFVESLRTLSTVKNLEQLTLQEKSNLNFTMPVSAIGGEGVVSFSISPALPSGLVFSTRDGTISGAPNGPLDTKPFTITASDSRGQSSSQTFLIAIRELVVIPPPPPPPPPTYSVSAMSVNEGDSLTFSIATTNVRDGTSLPYNISGISAGDLSLGSLSGNVTILNNAASVTVGLLADTFTEGNETATFTLGSDLTKRSVTIVDTSQTPPPITGTITFAPSSSTTTRIKWSVTGPSEVYSSLGYNWAISTDPAVKISTASSGTSNSFDIVTGLIKPHGTTRFTVTVSKVGYISRTMSLVVPAAAIPGSQVFDVPGVYQFVVPVGVTSISAVLKGAGGGAGGADKRASSTAGRAGLRVEGIIFVSPGETLTIYVGGGGEGGYSGRFSSRVPAAVGGFGYGKGGDAGSIVVSGQGGGGGGGSAILRSTIPLIVAGGGGGAGGAANDSIAKAAAANSYTGSIAGGNSADGPSDGPTGGGGGGGLQGGTAGNTPGRDTGAQNGSNGLSLIPPGGSESAAGGAGGAAQNVSKTPNGADGSVIISWS